MLLAQARCLLFCKIKHLSATTEIKYVSKIFLRRTIIQELDSATFSRRLRLRDKCMGLLSRVLLCGTPGTLACQAPLSMESPRKEYWSGLPFPTLGDLPDPGIKPASPASPADSLLLSRWGSMQSRRENCTQS